MDRWTDDEIWPSVLLLLLTVLKTETTRSLSRMQLLPTLELTTALEYFFLFFSSSLRFDATTASSIETALDHVDYVDYVDHVDPAGSSQGSSTAQQLSCRLLWVGKFPVWGGRHISLILMAQQGTCQRRAERLGLERHPGLPKPELKCPAYMCRLKKHRVVETGKCSFLLIVLYSPTCTLEKKNLRGCGYLASSCSSARLLEPETARKSRFLSATRWWWAFLRPDKLGSQAT